MHLKHVLRVHLNNAGLNGHLEQGNRTPVKYTVSDFKQEKPFPLPPPHLYHHRKRIGFVELE